MSRYAIKFPFRVRIHGGEFDESARAIHREDGLKTIQAESGIVLESTIERKQMSTKTTFKRIALVTVAALGFGVMSVAPSQADNSILRFVSGDGQNATNPLATGNGVAGAFNYVTLQTVSPAADYVVTTDSSFGTVTAAGGATATVSSDKKSFVGTGSAGVNPIQVMTPTVGTVTVQYWVRTGGVLAATAAETVTITVRATAQYLVPSAVTSYLIAGESTSALIADVATSADAVVVAPAAAPLASATTNAAATVKILVKDALGNVVDDSVTATITVGSISNGANIGSNVATNAAGDTAGRHNFYVYANGSAGVSTISFKVGTVTFTETITFSGLAATYSSALADATIATGKNVPVAGTVSYKVTARDSAGNLVPDGTPVYGYSATATNATVTTSANTVSGVATLVVTGVAPGTSVITFGNAATLATSTVTSTQTVEVTKSTAATVTLTLDSPDGSYNPGDKITITIKATDSNGKGIADGTRAVLTGFASNFQLTSGSALSDTTVFLGGIATQSVFAPAVASPGSLVFTATEGAATDSTTKAKLTVSATLFNAALTAAQEATDAALEAIDAGIAAKDAADQAVEAADAATIAAQDAAQAAADAGEMAVAAAEAAGEIATEALDAANAATDAALSAAEAADAATAAATEAKESADAATAAVAALSAEVTKLMAALTAKVTTLSTLVAKIAKKVKA